MTIDRNALLATLTEYTCGQRCMGEPGNRGGCCTVAARDFIIGPMADAQEFIGRLESKLGRPVAHAEVFIDHEEGSALFPDRSTWQDARNYPSLRVLKDDALNPCRFYDAGAGACGVYDIRPQICRTYQCEVLTRLLSQV